MFYEYFKTFGTEVAKILNRSNEHKKGGTENDTRKMEPNEKFDLASQ